MDYTIFDTGDVPLTDLGGTAFPADNDIRQIDAALGAEDVRLKLWYFDPGDEVDAHAHLHQEEIYYVLEGEFAVTLGDPGDTETRTVGPGAWWIAAPEVSHGHRYTGEDRGVLLAIGAPAVDEEPSDPADLTE